MPRAADRNVPWRGCRLLFCPVTKLLAVILLLAGYGFSQICIFKPSPFPFCYSLFYLQHTCRNYLKWCMQILLDGHNREDWGPVSLPQKNFLRPRPSSCWKTPFSKSTSSMSASKTSSQTLYYSQASYREFKLLGYMPLIFYIL